MPFSFAEFLGVRGFGVQRLSLEQPQECWRGGLEGRRTGCRSIQTLHEEVLRKVRGRARERPEGRNHPLPEDLVCSAYPYKYPGNTAFPRLLISYPPAVGVYYSNARILTSSGPSPLPTPPPHPPCPLLWGISSKVKEAFGTDVLLLKFLNSHRLKG